MFGAYLFVHLAGLALWLGSIIMLAILLTAMKRNVASQDVSQLAQRSIKLLNRVTHPSAFLILVSGVLMLIKMDLKQGDIPLWLNLMQSAGGAIIILFIIVVSIWGKKTVKSIAAGNASAAAKSISGYVGMLLIAALLILAIVYIVSAKIT